MRTERMAVMSKPRNEGSACGFRTLQNLSDKLTSVPQLSKQSHPRSLPWNDVRTAMRTRISRIRISDNANIKSIILTDIDCRCCKRYTGGTDSRRPAAEVGDKQNEETFKSRTPNKLTLMSCPPFCEAGRLLLCPSTGGRRTS